METENSRENREGKIELDISFSLDQEIKRVNYTLGKLAWYRENYGKLANILPEGVGEETTEDEITQAVEREFTKDDYNQFVEYINEEWKKVAGRLEILKNLSAFNLLAGYSIFLTKYGMGGSYDAETGEVVVNINRVSKEKIMGVIIHEIIHIGIEHIIRAHNIEHWSKERLVDLIGEKYFADLVKTQNIKEDVEVVDEAFNEFFPDLEAVGLKLGEKIDL